VLGVGGVRMLHALGFDIRQYHMNEGHSALLTLELLRRHAYAPDDVRPGESRYDIPRVRAMCNFTTHTPVERATTSSVTSWRCRCWATSSMSRCSSCSPDRTSST